MRCSFCVHYAYSQGRSTLRFSVHCNLVVPFDRSATMQTRYFSLVGLLVNLAVNGTLAVLRSCHKHRPKRVVYTSSMTAVYGQRSFRNFRTSVVSGLPIDLRHLPNGACSKIPPPYHDCSFSAWPTSGSPLSRDL